MVCSCISYFLLHPLEFVLDIPLPVFGHNTIDSSKSSSPGVSLRSITCELYHRYLGHPPLGLAKASNDYPECLSNLRNSFRPTITVRLKQKTLRKPTAEATMHARPRPVK